MKSTSLRKKTMGLGGCRLDASFHLSEGTVARRALAQLPYKAMTIKKALTRSFFGGRDRRIYVSNPENGIPFLGGSTMLKADLTGVKLISKKLTSNVNDTLLDSGWILVSRSGTVGKCVFSCGVHKGMAASEDVIRLVPNDAIPAGVLYAFLSSKYGYALLSQGTFGSVIQHVEPKYIESLSIPVFPEELQERIHTLIVESARLREEAEIEDKKALQMLKSYTGLRELSQDDYNYFGPRSVDRKTSCFKRNISNITSLSINAFNYSERTRKFIEYLESTCECLALSEMLDENGIFSTGSFPRLEYNSPSSIRLINQSDIFNMKLSGKLIANNGAKLNNLVKYGEIIIAGVGTLGESETFCRTLFANESLTGQLISGEFLRMNTNAKFPAGYLYTWLHSEYGFRLIRSTQSGTKLCRPIQKMLLQMPVPIIDSDKMNNIHNVVIASQTQRHIAAEKESAAIQLVEEEIEKWQK